MAIVLPAGLPAARALAGDGVEVLRAGAEARARTRPLRIGLLNLMPTKARTEYQFARVLAYAPATVELVPLVPESYRAKNAPAEHMRVFYRHWSPGEAARLDGLIVTGAPVETLPFGAVYYWPELTRIFDKARHRVPRTLYICWGAQAALHHFHGVPKHALARKAFGVFRHDRVAESALLDGLGDGFPVPVSRHTEVRAADLPAGRGLRTLAGSAQSGLCLVQDAPGRALYMFNHLEYDTRALADEYWRDRAARLPVQVPAGCFPHDDPSMPPVNTWRGTAARFFGNWVREVAGAVRLGVAA